MSTSAQALIARCRLPSLPPYHCKNSENWPTVQTHMRPNWQDSLPPFDSSGNVSGIHSVAQSRKSNRRLRHINTNVTTPHRWASHGETQYVSYPALEEVPASERSGSRLDSVQARNELMEVRTVALRWKPAVDHM
ncbi:hypothetical protein SCLCIDRAFT_193171 [Scleroderma citrinum Foug A]|uniref:Uncharacterized protein n=1 Tax=Scleroderma citrinum Foug A TaxID=1036808 RepID=A0A0C3DL48_9AGAM|nr:hypothetical protein SCLCIDRAFT_193171 [Scleroderma citrinum Foug A]